MASHPQIRTLSLCISGARHEIKGRDNFVQKARGNSDDSVAHVPEEHQSNMGRGSEPWWRWMWVVVGLATLGLASGATLEAASDEDRCVTTYNIQEYHVHVAKNGEEDQTTGGVTSLKKPPTLAVGVGGGVGGFVRREQLYREKSKWLRRIDKLQSQLIAEKMKRLGQMDRISVATPSGGTQSSPQRLRDQPANDVSKQDRLAPGKIKPETTAESRTVPPEVDVMRFMTDIRLTMRQVLRELNGVKSKNTRLYRTYKRLAGSHRQMHKEYLRSQERLQSLQAFHRTEIARIREQVGNGTDKCEGAVAALRRQVACISDPGDRSCTKIADGGSVPSPAVSPRPDGNASAAAPGVTVRPTPSGRTTDSTER